MARLYSERDRDEGQKEASVTLAFPDVEEVLHARGRVDDPPRVSVPVGVAIVGSLWLLFALFLVLGAVMFVASAMVANFFIDEYAAGVAPEWLQPMIAGTMAVFAAGMILISVFFVTVAVGTFKGKGWAWYVTIVWEALWGLYGLMMLLSFNLEAMVEGLITLGLAALIIWYYFEPTAKRWFKKEHMEAFWQKTKASHAA